MKNRKDKARALRCGDWLGFLPWDEILFVTLGFIGTGLPALVVWAYL